MNNHVWEGYFSAGVEKGLLIAARFILLISVILLPPGLAWSAPQAAGPASHAISLALEKGSGGIGTAPLDTWYWRNPMPTGYRLLGVTYGNGIFVAVGYGGTIITSPDGVTWTQQYSGVGEGLTAVAYGNGTFVAVGYGPTIVTSPDGVTWSIQSAASCNGRVCTGPGAIIYADDAFMAAGDPLDLSHTLGPCTESIRTSPDGVTWAEQALSFRPIPAVSPAPFTGVAYGNNTFVAVSTMTVAASPDGVTWTDVTPQFWPPKGLLSVTYANGMFVAVGDGGIATSPDGNTWTDRYHVKAGDNQVLRGITYGNGLFVAVGNMDPYCDKGCGDVAFVLISTDGVTWTKRSQPAGDVAEYRAVAYGNNTFVAVGGIDQSLDGGAIATSPNGVTWTLRTFWTAPDLYALAHGNDTFVAVGSDRSTSNGVIFRSPDGKTWNEVWSIEGVNLRRVAYRSNAFVAWNEWGDMVVTSPDGITWTEQRPPVSPIMSGVAYGNNTYVGLGKDSSLYASPDGITWTKQTSGTDMPLYQVTFGKGIFVAVGGWCDPSFDRPGVVLTSPDGITWTARTDAFYTYQDIIYGNGIFVARGLRSTGNKTGVICTTIVAASSDGVTWKEARSLRGAGMVHAFAYGFGTFLAAADCDYDSPYGRRSYLLSSLDGITWTERGQRTKNIYSLAVGNGTFVGVGQFGTVIQSAPVCTYTASRSQVIFGDREATVTIRISAQGRADCPPPEIHTSADWITHSDLSFGGNKGSVTLKASTNELSALRSKVVRFGNAPVPVYQRGAPCRIISLASADKTGNAGSFDKAGGTGAITVNVTPSDCRWTAVKSPAAALWAVITSGHGGTGTGAVAYSVKANKSGKARSAKVNVVLTKGGARKTFDVDQGK